MEKFLKQINKEKNSSKIIFLFYRRKDTNSKNIYLLSNILNFIALVQDMNFFKSHLCNKIVSKRRGVIKCYCKGAALPMAHS